MKYMLSKAMVAESIVWFCSEACPELLEEMQKANSHFQTTLLEAEAVMSSRGIQSAHLDWQTPERLKKASCTKSARNGQDRKRSACLLFAAHWKNELRHDGGFGREKK
ncbi:MAG: hypothetical protein WDO12_02810 [Pseudomonadota bacterium]